MRKLLGLLGAIVITSSAIITVIDASAYHTREQIQSENDKNKSLQANNLEGLKRTKRSIKDLPSDAHKIIIHNMRHFDVYGSSSGAYKVKHGSNIAEKIPGIDGNVIHGIIADKYFQQKYNIYFTVKNDNCEYEYYALKDRQTTAHKINGLPDDATLLSIHNLAGVIFFGSSNGAYELVQGQLQASKISHVKGNVVKIKLNGSARKYDADFITISGNFNKCKHDLEFKKLEGKLNQCKNETSIYQVQINTLKESLINQQNKFQLEKNEINLEKLKEVLRKYNSLDPERFLPDIEETIKSIKQQLQPIDIDVRNG